MGSSLSTDRRNQYSMKQHRGSETSKARSTKKKKDPPPPAPGSCDAPSQHLGSQRKSSKKLGSEDQLVQSFSGQILGGRFRLGQVIGTGSSGSVFVGWDILKQKRVAIKRIDARAQWERRRECDLAIRRANRCIRDSPLFVCPQTVLCDDSFDKGKGGGDKCYVVMDLQGPDMRHTIRTTGGMILPDVACALSDLLEAINFLHKRGFVHRDIKPENCFWDDKSRRVRLGDFGLTRQVSDIMTPQMVTRWYRSPELLCGASQYGAKVDVFATGLVTIELLTGQPTCPGSNEVKQLDLLRKLLGGDQQSYHGSTFELLEHGLLGKEESCSAAAANSDFLRCKVLKERRDRIMTTVLASKPHFLATAADHTETKHHGCLPTVQASFIDLLARMLAWDPDTRLTALEALQHPFFTQAAEAGWLGIPVGGEEE